MDLENWKKSGAVAGQWSLVTCFWAFPLLLNWAWAAGNWQVFFATQYTQVHISYSWSIIKQTQVCNYGILNTAILKGFGFLNLFFCKKWFVVKWTMRMNLVKYHVKVISRSGGKNNKPLKTLGKAIQDFPPEMKRGRWCVCVHTYLS